MNALRFSAVDLGPVGWDPAYGHGRVRAVEADAYVPDTSPPVVSRVSPGEGSWLVQARVTYQLTPGQDIGDLHTTGDVTQAGTSGGVGSQVVSWDPVTGVLVMDHGLTGTTGPKDVVFRVTDTSGNTTSISTRFRRDVDPPGLVSTTDPTPLQTTLPVRLTGRVSDVGSGVSHVTGVPCGGGASVTVPVGADGTFTYALATLVPHTQACLDFTANDNVGLSSPQVRIYSTYAPPTAPSPQPATGVIPPALAATPPRPVAPAPAPAPVPVSPPAPVKQAAPAVAVSPQVRTTGIARLTTRGVLTVPVRVAGRGRLLVTVPGTTWRRTITVTATTRQLRLTLPRKVASKARTITLRTTKTTRTIPLARPR